MKLLNQNRALVLFSGGQDSTIALAWALERFDEVCTVGFDYGQRHVVEIGARTNLLTLLSATFRQWASKLGGDTLINIEGLGRISETALTRTSKITWVHNEPPNTFVPGRNLIFLNFAGALAYRLGAGRIIGGMCENDIADYPDCRADAIEAQAQALRLGMDADIHVDMPLLSFNKAEGWRLAEELGGETLVQIVNEHSHTCYLGVRDQRHEWGYGCGECPACTLRADGWRQYITNKEFLRKQDSH